MKKILFLTYCLLVFTISNLEAQTAEILFVNNNGNPGAANLDLEVRLMPQDSLYVKYSGIAYHGASTILTVPANVIVKLDYLEAGTTTVYYTQNNVVYNPGQFRIPFLYGTSTSNRYSVFTGYKQSSDSSKIKYDFVHSTSSLQDVDLIIRETGEVLANNFTYTDATFAFGLEFGAVDYTLDLLPDTGGSGLFSYLLPGATLRGEYILLFTSGSGSLNDMYMVQMNGTVTKLVSTPPISGINDHIDIYKSISLYPNPVNNIINLNLSEFRNAEGEIIISSLSGEVVYRSKLLDQHDVSNFNNGVYIDKVIIDDNAYCGKLVISK